MRRTQIYLDDEQDRQLGERAARVGETKSALIREAIDRYLGGDPAGDAGLEAFRSAVRASAGTIPRLPPGVDYLEDVRAGDRERARELEARRRS